MPSLVFVQWNPNAPVWGAPYWAHVMTYDLAHWTRLPVALVPDSLYDYDGAFSGSASIKADGQPVLLYTGVSHKTELDFYYAVSFARHIMAQACPYRGIAMCSGTLSS